MTAQPLADYKAIFRHDLMSFIERSFTELNASTRFLPGPHLEVMASKLDLCRRGKLRRLVVSLPPRSLKSHTVSVAFVAWLLGHDPAKQIICASYGQDLADKHARDCRTLMQSGFYQSLFPEARLSPDKQSVNEFMTTRQGFRLSTSVGGVLTGRGADVIILDDPLKPADAMSETGRKAVNDWYDNTLLSRLNNKEEGVIIIVMQRLHQDDLVGHVLEKSRWEVLSFPAIAEVEENWEIESFFGRRSFRRHTGEALHPERESVETLTAIRGTIGQYNFSSQYQQTPIPAGGAIVKTEWLRYYDPDSDLPEFSHIVQSWDTANKAGELNDYSVCTTWGVHDRHTYYLLDVFRARLDFPALKKAAIEQQEKHNATMVLVEDKASGTQLIQELQNEGYPAKAADTPPGSDKIVRLYAQMAVFESGQVLLPQRAAWLPEYQKEVAVFPGGKFDDQVDSTTQALEFFTRVLRHRTIYDCL